jgi:hypothetical protein
MFLSGSLLSMFLIVHIPCKLLGDSFSSLNRLCTYKGNSFTLLVEAYLSETCVSMHNPLQCQNPENCHQTGILGRLYNHYCGRLEEEQTTFVMFVFRKFVCNLRDFRLPP